MKANEFVRKFGLDAAKHKADELKIIESMGDKLSFEDANLKRIVESHELVRSYKGCGKPKETALATAKFTLRHLKSTRKLEIELFGSNNRELELERAILDVESCQ